MSDKYFTKRPELKPTIYADLVINAQRIKQHIVRKVKNKQNKSLTKSGLCG